MKKSAGILLYRLKSNRFEFLLAHPGGPLWGKKDDGAWSIPKGEFDGDETPIEAAKREFKEEMGEGISGEYIPLKPVKTKSKLIYAFAIRSDFDTSKIKSNTFKMEWPPNSGNIQEFPEIDKGDWFDVNTAKIKLLPSQLPILEELIDKLDAKE